MCPCCRGGVLGRGCPPQARHSRGPHPPGGGGCHPREVAWVGQASGGTGRTINLGAGFSPFNWEVAFEVFRGGKNRGLQTESSAPKAGGPAHSRKYTCLSALSQPVVQDPPKGPEALLATARLIHPSPTAQVISPHCPSHPPLPRFRGHRSPPALPIFPLVWCLGHTHPLPWLCCIFKACL